MPKPIIDKEDYMMCEIGSEFWMNTLQTKEFPKTVNLFDFGFEQRFILSGRTAIEYVLQDINKNIESVYMPSYCCKSMMQPFLDRAIDIYFYDVINDLEGLKYIIDYGKTCDVFFATSYFGFSNTAMDSIIEVFKDRGAIVIEDITHRLLSEQPCCNKADYNIASLRKWFAIPSGGLAVKQRGRFGKQSLDSVPSNLINNKIRAMMEKGKYINKCKNRSSIEDVNKKEFIDMFSQFNNELNLNYKGIAIDELSRRLLYTIDVERVKKKRRENASFIHENLKKYNFVKPLINKPDFKKDCPLFFPVRIRFDLREKIKSYLVANEIYCPIHWPIPNESHLNLSAKKIYEEELSLICDQRYDVNDMQRIINTLDKFWSEL